MLRLEDGFTTLQATDIQMSDTCVGPKHRPDCTPSLFALPSELAFWALWHCRHARPPDAAFSC